MKEKKKKIGKFLEFLKSMHVPPFCYKYVHTYNHAETPQKTSRVSITFQNFRGKKRNIPGTRVDPTPTGFAHRIEEKKKNVYPLFHHQSHRRPTCQHLPHTTTTYMQHSEKSQFFTIFRISRKLEKAKQNIRAQAQHDPTPTGLVP